MIHASVELIEAMRGVAPVNAIRTHSQMREAHAAGRIEYGFEIAACRSSDVDAVQLEWACEGFAKDRDTKPSRRVANCPACLRLMREATDPVRWDWLETRGLAPKLPLEDAA